MTWLGELGVSRNTVALAFDWLASEGYVECRVGAGTFVAGYLPESKINAPLNAGHAPARAAPSGGYRAPVAFSGRMPAAVVGDRRKLTYDFWYGRLDWREFPVAIWRRLINENFARAGANMVQLRPSRRRS